MATKNNTDLVATLEDIYKQAPNLPPNVQEILVKIAPWIALIFGILAVIGGLGVVGISPLAALGGIHAGFTVLISGVVTIVSGVMELMAFPQLKANKMKGWTLLFWVEVLGVVSSVLTLSVGSVLGALIGAAIGFYLLFQIKSYYK